jgi:hypothetical protein
MMESYIFWSIYSVANFLLFYCFILSTRYLRHGSIYTILAFYFLVTLVVVLLNTLSSLNLLVLNNTYLLYYNLFFTCFHFFSLSQILKFKIENKIIVGSIQIIGLLTFIFFIVFTDTYRSMFSIATTSNILLVFLSLLYYNDFQSRSDLLSSDDIFFNIATGIFLSSGMLTPILIMSKFLKEILTRDSYYIVSCIAPISSIVFYVFTIKFLKCTKVDI